MVILQLYHDTSETKQHVLSTSKQNSRLFLPHQQLSQCHYPFFFRRHFVCLVLLRWPPHLHYQSLWSYPSLRCQNLNSTSQTPLPRTPNSIHQIPNSSKYSPTDMQISNGKLLQQAFLVQSKSKQTQQPKTNNKWIYIYIYIFVGI